jgi:hypothetical protein
LFGHAFLARLATKQLDDGFFPPRSMADPSRIFGYGNVERLLFFNDVAAGRF